MTIDFVEFSQIIYRSGGRCSAKAITTFKDMKVPKKPIALDVAIKPAKLSVLINAENVHGLTITYSNTLCQNIFN